MLYFGIDWSRNKHQLCIRNDAGATISQMTFAHSLAGFHQLEAERCKLGVPPSECLVAIETAHNLVVDFMLERAYPVYIIPPQATAGYRNRQRLSGAHDDQSDAALLAGILRTDRASHRRVQPTSALFQQLQGLVRLIETLRRSIQRQASQLHAALLRTYPPAVDLFSDLTTYIALEFLAAYPTLAEAQRLSLEQFSDFCHQHGYKRRTLIARRYTHLLAPAPPVSPAVSQAYRVPIQTLAQVLLPQVQARAAALSQLSQLFAQHADAPVFSSLPGAGPLLAAALLVKFGEQRERFPSAAEAQALAGTCPVTKRSGQKKLIQFRWGCDKEFRRIAQQFAQASRQQSGWATAYWHDVRPACGSDSHAYRILANRWLAIIWKLWQTGKPYDEAYHVQQRALRRRPKSA